MDIEIIERKGIGHPDTIADNLSELLANKLKQAYTDQYGRIMHYNVDKTMCCAGKVINGEFLKPVKIVFAGQYTLIKNINTLLTEVVEEVLKFEISKGMKYEIHNFLNEGSPDLTGNFNKKKSNDTSFAVGTYPTENENLVRAMGEYLDGLHSKDSDIGTDNKIMFIDDKNNKRVYIALAFLDGEYDYFIKKEEIKKEIKEKFGLEVLINNADDDNIKFITYTGTSLEMGDSGATGRGNRNNGLITPCRPMTLEAYCGKNDQTHIGRIYQDKATEIAKKRRKDVILLNKIGQDINDFEIFEI